MTATREKEYNLKVSENVWQKVRVHVAQNNLRIKPFVENLINNFFNKNENSDYCE